MTISHIGTAMSAYVSHSTTPDFTFPAVTVNAGDFILLSVQLEDGDPGTITPPTGYSAVGTHAGLHSSVTMYGAQFYKIAAGGEDDISGTTGGSTSGISAVSVYRSDTGTAALDAAGAWNQTTGGSAPTASITTVAANAMRVWYNMNYNGNTTAVPAGWNGRANQGNTSLLGDLVQASAGASGALTGTGSFSCWTRVVSITDGGGGAPALRRYSLPLTGVG